MEKKLKVGVIGVGNIAGAHIDAYRKNPNVELYAFCDINEKRLASMGEKYEVERLYTDLDEMLALPELDAVSVCTWNSAHAPCTIAALNAGKHVLCEKPMSITAQDAEAMQAAAEKNGKLLMIGFVRRFGPDMKILRELYEDGFFGDLYFSKVEYLRRNGNPGGWFGDKSRSGGGPLIDLGVHVIDFDRFLKGKPHAVSVYGATFQKLYDRKNIRSKTAYRSSGAGPDDICDVEDLATALIRFEDGSVLSVEASFSLNIKNDEGKMQFFGTKAGASLSPELELYGELDGYMTDISLKAETTMNLGNMFCQEINHYVDCILNGTECISPACDGVEMMKILNAIYESAKTGHEVILKK